MIHGHIQYAVYFLSHGCIILLYLKRKIYWVVRWVWHSKYMWKFRYVLTDHLLLSLQSISKLSATIYQCILYKCSNCQFKDGKLHSQGYITSSKYSWTSYASFFFFYCDIYTRILIWFKDLWAVQSLIKWSQNSQALFLKSSIEDIQKGCKCAHACVCTSFLHLYQLLFPYN